MMLKLLLKAFFFNCVSQILHLLRQVPGLVPRAMRRYPSIGGRQHRRVCVSQLPAQLVGQFCQYEKSQQQGSRSTQEADKADTGEGRALNIKPYTTDA